jgi:hypothetical protein
MMFVTEGEEEKNQIFQRNARFFFLRMGSLSGRRSPVDFFRWSSSFKKKLVYVQLLGLCFFYFVRQLGNLIKLSDR